MLSIGQASQQTELPTKTIRYYEDSGLISPPQRGENGYRFYDDRNIRELNFAKNARQAGFSIRETKDLVTLFRDKHRASSDVKRLTLNKITEVRQRIDAMTKMLNLLESLAEQCPGDDNPQCAILDGLENKQL
jgi:Cu(I)-responsive transcriptional regulator